MPTRYYIHGDEHETKKGTHYCAMCDSFESNFNEHRYTKHSDKNDYERYLSSKKRIKNILADGKYVRPESADKTNLVA